MLNSRSMHGINVIGLIASAPRHQSVTTSRLARQLGLSVSFTESLMKDLKEADLLRAHRGPGGGYQLQQAVSGLSVWDVVSCFTQDEVEPKQLNHSPEFQAAYALHVHLDMVKRTFLETYPLADVIKHMPEMVFDNDTDPSSSLSFHFKPLQKQTLPIAPNSVFDLSNFLQLRIA